MAKKQHSYMLRHPPHPPVVWHRLWGYPPPLSLRDDIVYGRPLVSSSFKADRNFLWSFSFCDRKTLIVYLFNRCKKHNQSFIPGLEFPFSIFTSPKSFEVDKVNAVIKSLSHIGKFVILICRLNCHIGLKALGLKWFGSRIGWESM